MAKRNQALAAWLETQAPPRNTQTSLARRLHVGTPTINEILHGKKAPSLNLALRIEDLTGIHPRAFEDVA